MPDQQITCATCGQRFTWSAGEQDYYRERNLQPPRRCPDCRAAKREQAPATAARRGPTTQAQSGPVARRAAPRRAAPRRVFGVATLVAAVGLSAALFLLIPSTPLMAWLIAINLTALLTYGYDKSIAGGTRTRVPEAVLLGLALVGGSIGALAGMLLFRHKTSKPAFLIPFALIVALQVGLIIAWLVLGQGG